MIADLEEGLETDMTRQFNDKGAELSGGQWQKVAISRAFSGSRNLLSLMNRRRRLTRKRRTIFSHPSNGYAVIKAVYLFHTGFPEL